MAPRTVVVVNPASQGGRVGKQWPQLRETLCRAFPFEDVQTKGPGQATTLVRQALKRGAERIVALGGDGTISEVVNGFFDDGIAVAPNATFALIPFGTGGDFRRTMHIPTDTGAAAAIIAGGHRKKIDIGRIDVTGPNGERATRMFANIASFGMSGVVDRLVNASGKKLGRLSYSLATARATWSYENQRVALTFDDRPEDRAEMTIHTVAVANGRYFGGAMKIAPNAEVDDGMFDVVAMGDLGFGDLLTSGLRIYKGTHLSLDKVTSRRARVVDARPIDPSAVVELDVDGEAIGRLPARFEVLPSALWMAVPSA